MLATTSGISSAVASPLVGIAFCHNAINHCNSTPDATLYKECTERTVLSASTAFHAIVKCNNLSAVVMNFKDSMRANLYATFATGALFYRKL